jgi:hypothetical protein
MRIMSPLLALLGLAHALFAADSFVGSWRLNGSKSKYTAGMPPKEETIVIQETGGQMFVAMTGTAPNGVPLAASYKIPTVGGTAKATGDLFDSVTAKRVNDTTLEISYMKAGKEIRAVRSTLAKDGNTLTVTILRGMDSQGKPVKGVSVFDKQ